MYYYCVASFVLWLLLLLYTMTTTITSIGGFLSHEGTLRPHPSHSEIFALQPMVKCGEQEI